MKDERAKYEAENVAVPDKPANKDSACQEIRAPILTPELDDYGLANNRGGSITDTDVINAIMDAFEVCDYEASYLINRVAENMRQAA